GAVTSCASYEHHISDFGWVRTDDRPPRECLTDSVVLYITGTRSAGGSYQTVVGLFLCVGVDVVEFQLRIAVKTL
ncbi:hypothetical protein SCD92_19800, partial [Gilvimarinus sp. SDUM040013]